MSANLPHRCLHNPFVPPSSCPVNDLPTELLAHIFYLGALAADDDDDEDEDDIDQDLIDNFGDWIDTDEDGDRDADDDDDDDGASAEKSDSDVEDDLPFQVLVSHVCRHWREVAIDIPALWTYLDFSEGRPFHKSRTWIDRSKHLPLDIDIDCADHDQDYIPVLGSLPVISEVLDIIQPHVERWNRLEVMVDNYAHIHLVLTRISECKAAPQLEVLRLYHYEEFQSSQEFHPPLLKHPLLPFHGNAPKLKIVTLWGVHIHWPTHFLSGLVDLELAYHTLDVRPTWEEFSRMLTASPQLTSLSLAMSGPADLPTDPLEQPVELPALLDLTLAYQPPEYISPLMKLLSVPNVRSLALDFDIGDYSSFARQLATPPSSANARSLLAGLDCLKIAALSCDEKTMDRMYEQLTNLTRITLSCTFVDEMFFRKLMRPIPATSSPTSPSARVTQFYCPNLDTVTTTGIDGKSMKEFVEVRKAAGFPIKKVLMGIEDNVAPKDASWLRQHVEFEYFEPSDEEEVDEEDGMQAVWGYE